MVDLAKQCEELKAELYETRENLRKTSEMLNRVAKERDAFLNLLIRLGGILA